MSSNTHVSDRAEIDVMGVTVSVRFEEPRDVSLLERFLSAWRDISPTGLRYESRAAQDGERAEVVVPALTEQGFEQAASRFSTDVTLAALKKSAGKHLLLHAGGIAREDGAVVAIIGPSGRGKTTTIRNLAQHFGYVSDETVAITVEGRILPYRKPLSVITEGHQDKLQIAPSELGLRPLPEANLRLAGFVLLERREDGGSESKIEPISLSQALIDLVPQTSYLLDLPQPLHLIAEIVRRTGGVRRLIVGQPDRIVEVAGQLFEPGGYCEDWAQALPQDIGNSVSLSDVPYTVAEGVVDALECEEGLVVLTRDRQLRLLTGIGPVLWRGMCKGDDWGDIETQVETLFGKPSEESLRDALVRVCEELVEVGVLQTNSLYP